MRHPRAADELLALVLSCRSVVAAQAEEGPRNVPLVFLTSVVVFNWVVTAVVRMGEVCCVLSARHPDIGRWGGVLAKQHL